MTVVPVANSLLRAAVIFVLAAISLFAATPTVADDLDKIVERGRLVVGVKADYAPFGFRNSEGTLVGYDIDIARAFAETIGVPAELVPVTSANRLQKLRRGEIDVVVATMGDTRSRRELVHMVEPHYYGDGANVLLAPGSGISDWADLRGKTLCTIRGALWGRLAEERLLIDTIGFNSTRGTSLALRAGHCAGWLYDEVNLLNELRSGEWEGYEVSLPTRFILPWAVAIRKEEAGGRLDSLLGDLLAGWHRDGFLQDLERRWDLPPSPYLKRARERWTERDDTEQHVCRRDDAGRWPLSCRETSLVTSEGLRDLSGMALLLLETTGLDVSVLYDPTDRSIFLVGLGLTAALSVVTVVLSIVLGVVFGWLMHRRVPVVAQLLRIGCAILRMTPPLLQLYIVFLGLGGVVLALGFTLDAFTVAACVLSLYAGAANAVAFCHASDVAAKRNGAVRFRLSDIRAALALCFAALMGNCVNIVKATGMASTLALPELVSASTSIIAEKGNDGIMMNLLLLAYFVLVILVIQAFRLLERRVTAP